MPATRKPTAILALNGTLAHNPGRYADRASEPQDDRDLGPPPLHLAPEACVAWREIAEIAPARVLAMADRLIVELASVLLAQFRAEGATLSDQKIRRLESVLGQLGMTPATRSKVTARELPAPTNRFAQFGKRQ